MYRSPSIDYGFDVKVYEDTQLIFQFVNYDQDKVLSSRLQFWAQSMQTRF